MSSFDSSNPVGSKSDDNSIQQMDIDDSIVTNQNDLFTINQDSLPNQPTTNKSANDPVISTAGQQLIDFLQYLEDYKPTVPDSVTSHIMHTAGFNTSDPRILRLASLASQKFIADIANDALQHCKIRTAISANKKQQKDKRYTLTFEDLVPVLSEYGINIKKPQYFF